MKAKSMTGGCLIIFFEEMLRFGFCQEVPIDSLRSKKRSYISSGTDFDGFYDWLRRDGEIVGLRQNSHSAETLFAQLPEFDYLRKGRFDDVEVFFTTNKDFDRAASEDQSFAYNEFWLSPDGHLALAVDMGSCPLNEQLQIRQLPVQTVDIEVTPRPKGWDR